MSAASPEQIAFESAIAVVASVEPRVAQAIRAELHSQRRQLKLVASENYASPAVLLAMGNWLSDKYAEGIPGRRMYAGCEQIDEIERIAADHATSLFGAATHTSSPIRESTPTWWRSGPFWPSESSVPSSTTPAPVTSTTSPPTPGGGYVASWGRSG